MHLSDARYTSVPGRYDVTVTPEEGDPFNYTVAPDDDASMAVAIREAMAANPIPIASYVPPAPPRRMIRKSLVQQRLIDAGLMDDAYAALMAHPASFARWFAPDHPRVYADDVDAIALLAAIGANAEVILAPEA
jgi:hypothetical protein